MDIFSANPGTVVLADVSDGAPMGLFIDAWGGFNAFRSIVTGFRVELKGGVQFMHTLNEFIYIYTYGERMGRITLSGLAFYQECQDIEDELNDGDDIADHGLEEVIGYYGLNRVNFRPTAIRIVLGTTTAFSAFLTEMTADLVDTERVVGQWALQLASVPG